MLRLAGRVVSVSVMLVGCGEVASPATRVGAPGSVEVTKGREAKGEAGEVTKGGAAKGEAEAEAGEATKGDAMKGEATKGEAPPMELREPERESESAEVVEAVASEFHLAAYRDGRLGLYPMSNGVLLVVGAQAIAESAGGEPLSRRPGMTWGFLDPGELYLTDWHTGTVGGRWPDSTWISAYFSGQRWDSQFYVYYRKGERWQRKANVEGLLQWYYSGFAAWTDGQTLALRVQSLDPRVLAKYGSGEEVPAAAQKRHDAALAAARPRFDVLDAKPGAAAPPSFPARTTARAFTARVSGEIDAVVKDERGTLTLLRWAKGASEPQRAPLPMVENQLPGEYGTLQVVTHPDGGLWIAAPLAGGSYLARFDGEAWSLRSLPTKEPLCSLTAGDDGVLWAVTSPERYRYEGEAADQGHLWRSSDGEKWRKVALPTVQFADMAEKHWEYFTAESDYSEVYGDAEAARQRHRVSPHQVWSGGGEVWVAGVTGAGRRLGATEYSREVVLRTRSVAQPLGLPSDEMLRLELLDERAAKDFGFGEEEMCGPGLVTTFMSLPADAPKDGPVPVVEKLLREHPELALELSEIWEARHRGRRVVAFVAGNLEKTRVATVLALLQAEVPEKRSFACRQPIMVRPLYRMTELTEMGRAFRAAHPAP